MLQPESFSVTAALSDALDKSFGVTLQLTTSRGGDKQPRAACTPVAVLRYSNTIARDRARLDSKISLEDEQSVDSSSTRKAKPKPKEGSTKTNPFVATEADVDELSSEHLVDPYAQADLSWSDEAPRLKEIVHGHVEASSGFPAEPRYFIGTPHSSIGGKRNPHIDPGTQGLENVELSLAGNEIDDEGALGGRTPPKDAEVRLPQLTLKIECLSLVANRPAIDLLSPHLSLTTTYACSSLNRPPPLSHLVNLVHIGLSYNRISTLWHSTSATPQMQTKTNRCWVPPNLVSLDLSRNEITDVEQIRGLPLTTARKSLSVLNLQANPVSLHPHLSRLLSTWLPRLTHLNNVLVQKPDSTGEDGLDEVSMMKQVTFSIPSCAILPPPPPLAPLIWTSESKKRLSQTDKPPPPATNAALPPQPPEEICYSFRLSMFSGALLERPREVPEEANVSNPSAALPKLLPLDNARELLDPERNGLEALPSPAPGTASGSRPGSESSKAGAQVKKKDAPGKKPGKWTTEDVAAAYERTAVDGVEIARGVVLVADLLEGPDADVPLEELYPGVSPYQTIDRPPPTSSNGGVSITATATAGKKSARQGQANPNRTRKPTFQNSRTRPQW
ncbi:hypothetical protein M427DRAFT_70744 [Gonapodya prolifera JEL478]|uniref:L domain-like protein n=1 Tax=Gonapodya prolifera (strain JEL478) TaxID=1344416 RepID=A0A139ABX2_GONPJ|nr:hypothetical protein M427DRAFT_70744 [Gonapodya prolifera JEL478]|eukprot:KXS14301.1 hypothetical protein M427DRAFT_70744 [Gonapodya prolifera JEL478]